MTEQDKGRPTQKIRSETLVDGIRSGQEDTSETRVLQVEVVGGPMDGEKRRITGISLSIGRGEENDLPLSLDPTASLRHARVGSEGRRYWLEDLGSTNGTYIGEQRVEGRVSIGPGTVFVVGRTPIKFVAG